MSEQHAPCAIIRQFENSSACVFARPALHYKFFAIPADCSLGWAKHGLCAAASSACMMDAWPGAFTLCCLGSKLLPASSLCPPYPPPHFGAERDTLWLLRSAIRKIYSYPALDFISGRRSSALWGKYSKKLSPALPWASFCWCSVERNWTLCLYIVKSRWPALSVNTLCWSSGVQSSLEFVIAAAPRFAEWGKQEKRVPLQRS